MAWNNRTRSNRSVTTPAAYVDTTRLEIVSVTATYNSFSVRLRASNVVAPQAGQNMSHFRMLVSLDEPSQSEWSANNDSDHTFTFTGLRPSTTYYYDAVIRRYVNGTQYSSPSQDRYTVAVTTPARPNVTWPDSAVLHTELSNQSERGVTVRAGTRSYFNSSPSSLDSHTTAILYRNGSEIKRVGPIAIRDNNGISGFQISHIDSNLAWGTNFDYHAVLIHYNANGGVQKTYTTPTRRFTSAVFDPPVGKWSANPGIGSSSSNAGITLTSAPGMPFNTHPNTGTYDSVQTTKLDVYRSNRGASSYSRLGSILSGSFLDSSVVDFGGYDYYIFQEFNLIYKGVSYGPFTGASNVRQQDHNFGSRTVTANTANSFRNDTQVNVASTFVSVSGAYGSVRSRVLWQQSLNGGGWTNATGWHSWQSGTNKTFNNILTPSINPTGTVRYRAYMQVETNLNGVVESTFIHSYATTITKPIPNPNEPAINFAFAAFESTEVLDPASKGPVVRGTYVLADIPPNSKPGVYDEFAHRMRVYRNGVHIADTAWDYSNTPPLEFQLSYEDTSASPWVNYTYTIYPQWAYRYYGKWHYVTGAGRSGTAIRRIGITATFGALSASINQINEVTLSQAVTSISAPNDPGYSITKIERFWESSTLSDGVQVGNVTTSLNNPNTHRFVAPYSGRRYRLRVTVTSNRGTHTVYGQYSSPLNLSDPAQVNANLTVNTEFTNSGVSTTDSVRVWANAAQITVSSGFGVRHRLTVERSENGGSSWTTYSYGNQLTGSTNSRNAVAVGPYNRGSQVRFRARLQYTVTYNGADQYTNYLYSNVKTVTIPAYDGPTGTWLSPIHPTLTSNSSGNVISLTVPTTASGTGNYDRIDTTRVRIQRSSTSSISGYSDIEAWTNPSQGQNLSYTDTSAQGHIRYWYRIIHEFNVWYILSSVPALSNQATSGNTPSIINRSGARSVSASGTASLINNSGTALDTATMTGNITGVSGQGSVVSITTRWQQWTTNLSSKIADVGSSRTTTSFTHSHSHTTGALHPATNVRYRLYYSIIMRNGGVDDTTTGYINTNTLDPQLPDIPQFDVGIEAVGPNTAGSEFTLRHRSNLPQDSDITITSGNYQWYISRWTGSAWTDWTNFRNFSLPTTASVYTSKPTYAATGLTPFTRYRVYCRYTHNLNYYGSSIGQGTRVTPITEFTTSSTLEFDLSKPLVSLDQLSRATIQTTMTNYIGGGTIQYLDTTLIAYRNGVIQYQVAGPRINNPTLPRIIQFNDTNAIPNGVTYQYEVVVTAYNSTYTRSSVERSPKSDGLTGIEVPDREANVVVYRTSQLVNGFAVVADLIDLTGPGYDSISGIDATLQYRRNGSGDAWTNVHTFSSSTVPFSLNRDITGLTDTTVYDIRYSVRARGRFIGEDFDYVYNTTTQVLTFNSSPSGNQNLMRIINLGYGSGGIKVDFRSLGLETANGTRIYPSVNKMQTTVQRRLRNNGNTWTDLSVREDQPYSTVLSFIDTSGSVGTTYDYRIKTYTEIEYEVDDGVWRGDRFTNYTDHQTIQFINPHLDLLVDDYDAIVLGHFTIDHRYTEPSASNRVLKRLEWAPIGTVDWTTYSAATMDTLPRRTPISLRQVWGRTSGSDEQPSSQATVTMSGPPETLTSVTGIGGFAGNRVTWENAASTAFVEVRRNTTTLSPVVPAEDNNFLDPSASASVSYTYYVRQFFTDAGFRLYGPWASTSATRPVTPPTPSLPEIDSACYMGRNNDNVPCLHLAPQGTSLASLKNSGSLTNSYFHSSSRFLVVTDIKTSTGSLDASTKYLLANRAFLCTIIDNAGTVRASDMVLKKTSFNYYRQNRSSNTYKSNFSFGANTAHYSGGDTIKLPDWANSVKFYFLNVTPDGAYIDPRDNTNDIMLSPSNLKVNGLGLDNAKLLCGIGRQSNGNSLNALNYHDDVIPFNSGSITGSTYTGPPSSCIQVLGSAPSAGWSITPNKGRIDRVDSAGNRMPWWNAGFGRGRMEYLSTTTTDLPQLQHPVVFPDVTESAPGSGFFTAEISGSSTALDAGAEIFVNLGGTHQAGDMYGLIVTPIGNDSLPGTVNESYGSGKGTLVWTDFENSEDIAQYARYSVINDGTNPLGEEEPQLVDLKYNVRLERVSTTQARVFMTYTGYLEGLTTSQRYTLFNAPLRVTIIKMR